jgi:predicted DNA binding CopG/RHH family protein
MKKKNVQIPEQLLIDLWNYHLMNIHTPELEQRIQNGLQQKLDAVKRRADYQKQRVTHDKKDI